MVRHPGQALKSLIGPITRVSARDHGNFPGTKQTSRHAQPMSAFGGRHSAPLFDHLIGNRQNARWNAQAERFCCFEIDNQIKFGWLQHGKVAGLFALENTSRVNTGLTI